MDYPEAGTRFDQDSAGQNFGAPLNIPELPASRGLSERRARAPFFSLPIVRLNWQEKTKVVSSSAASKRLLLRIAGLEITQSAKTVEQP
jgi:hypothetical protein